MAVLGALSLVNAEASWSGTLPDCIAAHVRAVETLGGAPGLFVPDSAKVAVIRLYLYDPQVNRSYAAVTAHYDSAVLRRSDLEVFGAEAAGHFDLRNRVALRLGSVDTVEGEVIHPPDGRPRFISTRNVALTDDPDDDPHFVVGVSEDVTEQRATP